MPDFIRQEFEKLSPYKKSTFQELVMWANAGGPGNLLISDSSYETILKTINAMPEEIPTIQEEEIEE